MPGWAFLRSILHILDALPCYLGFLWPIWDSQKQTFADKIMSTYVIQATTPQPPRVLRSARRSAVSRIPRPGPPTAPRVDPWVTSFRCRYAPRVPSSRRRRPSGRIVTARRLPRRGPREAPLPARETVEPLWRESVGHELREERLASGKRLIDVAEEAGVSPQYLSEVERGLKDPSSELLAAIAGALGLSVAEIATRVASSTIDTRSPVCLRLTLVGRLGGRLG